MKYAFLLLSLAFINLSYAQDNEEKRLDAAKSYLLLIQPLISEHIDKVLDSITQQIPHEELNTEDKRALVSFLKEEIFPWESISGAMEPVMAKHFSVDEIQALKNFHSTEMGMRIMRKLPIYESEVAQVIDHTINQRINNTLINNGL